MKIGVSLPLPPKAPAVPIDPAVFARELERLGFESFWVPEHGVAPVHVESYSPNFEGGQVPGFLDPIVALARASTATQRIKLGTSVMLIPEHNPILLAKEIATLDLYSGGRFILGIGSGWLKEETAILGGDPKRPWAQTRESVLVMKELWTKDVAEFHGAYYDFPPVRSLPKPAQKPHPPVYLGGVAGSVLRRVVEWGDGYLPARLNPEQVKETRAKLDSMAKEAGRDPRAIPITVSGQGADPDLVKRFEEAGAERVLMRLPIAQTEQEALANLEKLAEQVLR